MAHVEHYKAADIQRLANEWYRDDKWKDKEGRVDRSRTPQNYLMDSSRRQDSGMAVKRPAQLAAAVRGRLKNVKHSSRKDLNVISDWVVTLPKELAGREREFFRAVYDFTCERYGRENVLQGFVHADETSPHIHLPIVPVKDGRVSAKALFTRKELSSYHKDLDAVISAQFGMKGLIVNGRTKGDYTLAELKERTRRENELKNRENKQKNRENELKEREIKLGRREKAVEGRERAVERREGELDKSMAEVADVLQRASEALQSVSGVLAREKLEKELREAEEKSRAVKAREAQSRQRRLAGLRNVPEDSPEVETEYQRF